MKNVVKEAYELSFKEALEAIKKPNAKLIAIDHHLGKKFPVKYIGELPKPEYTFNGEAYVGYIVADGDSPYKVYRIEAKDTFFVSYTETLWEVGDPIEYLRIRSKTFASTVFNPLAGYKYIDKIVSSWDNGELYSVTLKLVLADPTYGNDKEYLFNYLAIHNDLLYVTE